MQIWLNGGNIWQFYAWFMAHFILVTTEACILLQVKQHQYSMIISHGLDIFPHCFKDLTQCNNGEIWGTIYRFFCFLSHDRPRDGIVRHMMYPSL